MHGLEKRVVRQAECRRLFCNDIGARGGRASSASSAWSTFLSCWGGLGTATSPLATTPPAPPNTTINRESVQLTREVLLGLSARSLALVRWANTRPIPPSAVGAAGLPPNLRRPTLLALHFCWQFHHPPFCSRPHLSFLANTPPWSYHSSETSPGPLPFGISSKKMTKSLFLPPSPITLSFLLPSELATGMQQNITRTRDTQQSIRLNDLRTNDATTNNRSKNN